MGLSWLFPFGKKKVEKTAEELEGIRRAFATRHTHFRQLIQANTRAHELMAELEESLRGFTPYGMHHVRSLCTRLSTAIFQMVRHLDGLNPGGYQPLFTAFETVNGHILETLDPVPHPQSSELVLDLGEVGRDHADLCGPKMSMLGEAGHQLGMRVPRGFVITSEAFNRFIRRRGLHEEIDRLIQGTDSEDREAMFRLSSRLMQLVVDAPFPEELSRAVLDAYDRLARESGGPVRLAVRSSALGEDIEGAAFAGQYRSILNVDRDSLLHACREVMASKYSQQAMAYRLGRGLRDEDVAVCVGCMTMVEARASGVAYSRSPMNIRDGNVAVYSVWGLPKGVVDGSAETDEFLVAREPSPHLAERHVADKGEKYVCAPGEGVCSAEILADERDLPSLTDGQAVEVAEMAMRIEEYFGLPQDMEWALDESGRLFLLQCRPLLQVEGEGETPAASSLPEPIVRGGRTASPGVGVGPVFVVRKDVDILLLPDGAVMVLKQALPSRAAQLGRCSAVISEQGGVAGHLANVAREFGVPALFGVPDAQRILVNGQIVTVDADGRAIYDGFVAPLFPDKPRERIMRGSPVQAVLRDVARHIVRLNLTNPDGLDFKPQNCRTLHDIMRFCHEMGVREMFEFGTRDELVQAASRRLICNVPKQFWILNLDDGLDPEGENRSDGCVLLKHVRSIPMQALWEGMEAVPWEGPPPVHTQGLMSVMFEATVNTDLNPTAASRFSQKNYFMISKHYCSLQSRFGFHLCGVEAIVSERDMENYASFQFKGGAANLERRILRARFVGDILSEFDFRVRVREDNLFARLEGLPVDQMVHRLKVLGYLLTHTRQLDMIMTDRNEVARRRARFFNDFKMFEPKPGDPMPAGEPS